MVSVSNGRNMTVKDCVSVVMVICVSHKADAQSKTVERHEIIILKLKKSISVDLILDGGGGQI